MDSSLSVEAFLPLGVALAQPNPELVYSEAKCQYEALVAARTGTGATKFHATRSLQDIHLPLYYRSLFEEATNHIGDRLQWRLLTVCFAYKVKDRVLEYFSLLGSNSGYEWATQLREIVDSRGRDSAFDGSGDLAISRVEEEESKELDPTPAENDNRAGRHSYGLRSLSHRPKDAQSTTENAKTKPNPRKKTENPYFIIPTLPLAFPKLFFIMFFHSCPISNFTPSDLLSHPAATQLDLSITLEATITRDASTSNDFVRGTSEKENQPPQQGDAPGTTTDDDDADHQDRWDDFFSHILQTQEQLFNPDDLGRMERDADVQREGYEEIDLEMWCAQWRARRQSATMSEIGRQEMTRLKAERGTVDEIEDSESEGYITEYNDLEEEEEEEGKYTVDGDEEKLQAENNPDEEGSEEGGLDISPLDITPSDYVVEQVKAKAKKRARFNDEAIAAFREIPARPAKRRKRAKRYW